MRVSLPWLALLLVLAFAAGRAQTLGALDPLKVAPHIYELAFENEKVRVLKQTIRPGEWPPIHEHPDSVTIYLNPCAWLEEDSDGKQYGIVQVRHAGLDSGGIARWRDRHRRTSSVASSSLNSKIRMPAGRSSTEVKRSASEPWERNATALLDAPAW